MFILFKYNYISILLLAAVAVSSFDINPAIADDIIKEDKARLKEFSAKIKEHEGELKKVKGEEKTVFGKLKYIQMVLDRKKRELREIEGRKDEAELKINSTKMKIADLKELSGQQKEQLLSRAVSLYKLSDMQYLKILFSSSSYVEMLKRYKYLKLILNQDTELIDEYAASKKELEYATQALKKEKETLDETVKKVKNRELEVLAERNTKRILLLKIRREKDYYKKAIDEIKRSSEKLEELIVNMEKGAGTGKLTYREKFEDFKNILASPVDGTVVSFFGKEFVSRLDSYLFNNGIKFSLKTGHEVKVVFNGEVIYSDWFRGYGKVAIINHGEGYYTVYSHLSEFLKMKGGRVKRGEVIALSGDSASLTGPCLYFEVRHKGRSLDPMDWLEPTVDITKKARATAR